jgi:hypothetical protein
MSGGFMPGVLPATAPPGSAVGFPPAARTASSMPAGGLGSTNASVVATGFQV